MANEREPNPDDQVNVPFEKALAFSAWLGERHRTKYTLPTAEQLRAAKESGQIELSGPEWTREGFIYDPNTDTLNEDPDETATAGFRLGRELSS